MLPNDKMIMEKINIVIVDDRPDNLMMLESALENDGIVLHATTLPEDVIQICINQHVDIALIDVNMPGMNGFELLEKIKENPLTNEVIVVLITGYSMDAADVVKGLGLGAVDYLFKPLDLYITTAKVNSLISLVNHQREIINKNKELQCYQFRLLASIETAEQSKLVKENFLANMSHEIRTPLNAIMGLTYVLKESGLSESQNEIIQLMDYSTNSLLGLVNDILEISKIDAGRVKINKTATDVFKLIENICDSTRPMAHSKGLQLICEVKADVPQIITADALRLNQVLINLLNNAIKFTNKGEVRLTVSLANMKGTRALLKFVVIDTGIGIPEELIAGIFGRYEQLESKGEDKFGGSGLGLAIVKKLIELKGGDLKVESKVGEGSKFTFSNWYEFKKIGLPVYQPLKKAPELKAFNHLHVLLVDDNLMNRVVTEKILVGWNITVAMAENGLEAFKMVTANNYDLILMDIHMPVMDGLEATRKIRQDLSKPNSAIPIIAYSASVIDQEKDEALKAGVDDFVSKPFRPAVLHYKINKAVSKTSPTSNVISTVK